MIPVLRGLVLLVLAAGAHSASAYFPGIAGVFDFFLLVAVYYAVTTNQVTGMLVGAVCGLVQDALFAPILGLNAFSKALLGYLIGGLSTRILLNQTVPQLLVLAGATLLQALTLFALHLVLGLPADPPGRELLWRMLGNSVLGALLYVRTVRRTEKAT